MCYIRGGKPEGATRTYVGCNDKNAPIDQKPINVPHELYFAKEAQVWNGGGVCFINPEREEQANTLGNMYLITQEQFLEVVQQENNIADPIKIDFNKTYKNESSIARENSWYGNILYLGQENNAPIFTFTNQHYLKNEINFPNEQYLKTIMKGLIKSHKLKYSELEAYFLNKTPTNPSIINNAIRSLQK
tara:strand:- start:252182 stop:252748 length:567 start_codon:yes stop_codon:yes gene_type:complete